MKSEKSALDTEVGGNHYKDMSIQPIEFITKNGLGFCEGNVVKYISRHKNKKDLPRYHHNVRHRNIFDTIYSTFPYVHLANADRKHRNGFRQNMGRIQKICWRIDIGYGRKSIYCGICS